MTDDVQRGHDLARIRHHWGDAYELGYDSGSFWFRRRDDGAILQASTAAALLSEIRRDFSARPVPHDARTPR